MQPAHHCLSSNLSCKFSQRQIIPLVDTRLWSFLTLRMLFLGKFQFFRIPCLNHLIAKCRVTSVQINKGLCLREHWEKQLLTRFVWRTLFTESLPTSDLSFVFWTSQIYKTYFIRIFSIPIHLLDLLGESFILFLLLFYLIPNIILVQNKCEVYN